MAWTTPGTATAGEVLTAAFWNEQVRDNQNYLYTPPMCRVYRSSTLTGYSSGTEITWNAEDFDTDSMWSSGTDITINTAGIYLVQGSIYITGSATITRGGAGIYYNGALRGYHNVPPESSTSLYIQRSDVFKLAVNDTISAVALIAGGSGYSVGGTLTENHTTSRLSVTWIGKD
ncbi:MAG TPA: hypothetical protein VIG24_05755 [Acidimicrobiia bacterium]